eukprot:15173192-Ditylum_brightwellii.AAC.1
MFAYPVSCCIVDGAIPPVVIMVLVDVGVEAPAAVLWAAAADRAAHVLAIFLQLALWTRARQTHKKTTKIEVQIVAILFNALKSTFSSCDVLAANTSVWLSVHCPSTMENVSTYQL